MCGAGRVVCLIDPIGDVYACPFVIHDEFKAGIGPRRGRLRPRVEAQRPVPRAARAAVGRGVRIVRQLRRLPGRLHGGQVLHRPAARRARPRVRQRPRRARARRRRRRRGAAAGDRPLQAATRPYAGHVRADGDAMWVALLPVAYLLGTFPSASTGRPRQRHRHPHASARATRAPRTSPARSAGARASGCSCSTPRRARSPPASACWSAAARRATCSARRRSSATCSRSSAASAAARASPPAAACWSCCTARHRSSLAVVWSSSRA